MIPSRGDEPGVYILGSDITEFKALQSQLEHEAAHDPLTGLPNRRAFTLRLSRELERVRQNAEPLGLLFLDLDKFKDINDQHSSGGRLMLGFTPTENLTINATGLYQKTTLDGQNSWYPALGKEEYKTNARVIAPTSDNLRLYNVTGKWDLSFATVTATSSYYKWTLLRNSDYSPTLSGSRANATACRNWVAGGPAATGSTNPACTATQLTAFTD